jgi:ABC-type glycerol-3-phosphate transport system substrate-binding protein
MLDKKYIAPISGNQFVNKKAAMWVISRPYIGSDWAEDYGISNVAFLPMPLYDAAFTGIENGTSYYSYGSVGFAMNSGSKNKELAFKYLQYTLSEAGQTIWAQSGLSVPTLLSMQQDENAEWKKSYEFLEGIDQSAFTFIDYKKDAYTRIPATYARTGNLNKTYESAFYDEATSIFVTLGTKNVNSFIGTAQDQLTRFIG